MTSKLAQHKIRIKQRLGYLVSKYGTSAYSRLLNIVDLAVTWSMVRLFDNIQYITNTLIKQSPNILWKRYMHKVLTRE